MRIAVAGGGIGGLTAALCLRRQGFEVQVYERSPSSSEAGAGVQLSPNALQVMRYLGLERQLEALACEPVAAVLRRYRSGKPYISASLADFPRRYGAKYLHLHRADLAGALLQALRQTGAEPHYGRRLRGYRQRTAGIVAEFADGSEVQADLLVGADGVHSSVRQAMLGDVKLIGDHFAWRGLVRSEDVPQRLRPERMANIWLGPGRHFVAYYLRAGDLINFVAVRDSKAAGQQPSPEVAAAREAFAGWAPTVCAVLDACSECSLWRLFDCKPLARWSDGRAVLLGDACHPALPFQAQGGAMAIEDAYVLAQTLASANPSALAGALADYENRRKARVSRLQRLARGNAALFHAATVAQRARRRALFALGNLIPGAANARLDEMYRLDVTRQ